MRITLEEVRPAIWRRLLVPSTVRLARLHDVFQSAMGWTNSHLHSFTIDGRLYGMQFDDFREDELDETKFTIAQALGGQRRFQYSYDFGDDWQHEVVVENVTMTSLALKSAVCLDGQRSCPPEDCHGAYGYEQLLEAISNPRHEEFDEYMTWLGGHFDPEEFDLAEVNAALQHLGSLRGTHPVG